MLFCLYHSVELLFLHCLQVWKELRTKWPVYVAYLTFASLIHLQDFHSLRRDHTPPGGNLPKLQVLFPWSSWCFCFSGFLFLDFFCGCHFFCLFSNYQGFFGWLALLFYTLSLVAVRFIDSWALNTIYMLRTLKSSFSIRVSLLSPSQGHHTHLDSLGTALAWRSFSS